MEVNANISGQRGGKTSFKFRSPSDCVLLNVHHTVRNQTDGTVVRIRFTAAGFSANNERLIATDHRDNIFVFDLVRQRYWILSEQLKKITIIEGLSDGNLVALGNKEGLVFVIDLDGKQRVQKLEAHPEKIIHLVRTPQPVAEKHNTQCNPPLKSHPVNGTRSTDRRYFLVASANAAKLYRIGDLTELSSISYGLSSNNSFHPNGWHWLVGSNGPPSLISHNPNGIIRVHRINFTVSKELNTMRLIELYLKNTPPQTITFDRADGDADGPDEIVHTLKRLMEQSIPGHRVTMAQPTDDGQYYALLCGHTAIAFLALDSWLISRVVSVRNLFITQLTFVPSPDFRCTRQPSNSLVVRTTDNDLMLLNFGYGTTRWPPFIRPLMDGSGRGKCYKFAPAPNGRVLANVLQTGEVLLHNLDSYRLQPEVVRDPMVKGCKSLPVVGTRMDYAGKNTRTSSSSSASTMALYASRSTTALRSYEGPRELKLEHQMNVLQTKLSKTLPRDRLLPILKEYGEYPAKYRDTIWRTLQDLPGDAQSFGALLQRGHHPCVAEYERRFAAACDQRTIRCLKKIVSCLAHWCPVFGLIDYIPRLVLPFARQQPTDALGVFETVATVLLNQCQLWFEFAPLEPFNYLAMVENVLAEFEPRLLAFFRGRNIASRAYAMQLMETALAECCTTADQWMAVWDHVLSNEPHFLVFLLAAYSSVHRATLMALDDTVTADNFSIAQTGPLDVRRLIRRAYELSERCPDAIHPRNYFKSFTPLGAAGTAYRHSARAGFRSDDARKVFHNANNQPIDFTSSSDSSSRSPMDECPTSEGSNTPTYVSFRNFPKNLTDVRCVETGALQAEQRRLERKIIELEKLEHTLQERTVHDLIRQEHEQRVKEVERNVEEAIGREEQRVEMQRKLLLLHRKQLREREHELALGVHNAKLINDATVRERELETLLTKLERERQREETDLLFAEEDIKLRGLELLSRYPSGPDSVTASTQRPPSDGRPLEQRYQMALEQLAVQKLKLYDEIDRTYSTLGMPAAGVNEYTYRTVSDLRKVASVTGSERYPVAKKDKPYHHGRKGKCPPLAEQSTSQVQLYEDTIRRMEEQVKVLQRLKNDIKHDGTSRSD